MSIHVTRAPTVPLTSYDTKRRSHLKFRPVFIICFSPLADRVFSDSEICIRFPSASSDTIFPVSALQYDLIPYSMLTVNNIYYL